MVPDRIVKSLRVGLSSNNYLEEKARIDNILNQLTGTNHEVIRAWQLDTNGNRVEEIYILHLNEDAIIVWNLIV